MKRRKSAGVEIVSRRRMQRSRAKEDEEEVEELEEEEPTEKKGEAIGTDGVRVLSADEAEGREGHRR